MNTGSPITVAGVSLQCKHCGQDQFRQQTIELERVLGGTFLSLEVEEKDADIFVCARCGFLHWFYIPSGNDAATEGAN